MQTPLVSGLEALTNAILGIIVSQVLTVWLFGVSPNRAWKMTAVFFMASTLRAYLIRRGFNLF